MSVESNDQQTAWLFVRELGRLEAGQIDVKRRLVSLEERVDALQRAHIRASAIAGVGAAVAASALNAVVLFFAS